MTGHRPSSSDWQRGRDGEHHLAAFSMGHSSEPDDDGRHVTKVSAEQVRAARFRSGRDAAAGRSTPERIIRIATVPLPEDAG